MTATLGISSLWLPVVELATRLGLTPITALEDGMIRVYVERRGEAGDDWTLAKTLIALGHDPEVVARTAHEKLREMAPRLQKKLDELDPAHEAVLPAYGVGGDGTITALRVERDGSVRLSPELEAAILHPRQRLDISDYNDLLRDRRLTESWAGNAHVMLRRLEWIVGRCPACEGSEGVGHEDGCELLTLLDV